MTLDQLHSDDEKVAMVPLFVLGNLTRHGGRNGRDRSEGEDEKRF